MASNNSNGGATTLGSSILNQALQNVLVASSISNDVNDTTPSGHNTLSPMKSHQGTMRPSSNFNHKQLYTSSAKTPESHASKSLKRQQQ